MMLQRITFARSVVNPIRPAPSVWTKFYSTAPSMDPYQEEEMSKQLILVDENDNRIGRHTKKHCHLVKNGKLPLHRAFSVIMFNTQKDIILQQRSAVKVTYPLHITNGCCSHPLYETNKDMKSGIQTTKMDALLRMNYELGIPRTQIKIYDLKFITKVHYQDTGDNVWGEHEMDYVFAFMRDVDITPNPIEVANVWTIPRNEFDDFIKATKYPLTPWFKLFMKKLLFKIWDNLDDLPSIANRDIQRYC